MSVIKNKSTRESIYLRLYLKYISKNSFAGGKHLKKMELRMINVNINKIYIIICTDKSLYAGVVWL